jgi:hypothetical protein
MTGAARIKQTARLAPCSSQITFARRSRRDHWASDHHAANGKVQNTSNDDQKCPDHHDVPDVEPRRVHPAPDEGPDTAGDNSDDPMYNASILELLDQDYDPTDQVAKAG